ncbi:PhnD/SsuA/transferrin family substrate-binding protein [bacterium]|nr:PhnD/SsuA/transferrin family substrate-binding protein [bacterium]
MGGRCLLCILWLGLYWLCAWPLAADPATLRIGILSFEDPEDLPRQLRLQSTALQQSLHLRASFAVGTYGELLHWLQNDLVDVAVVNSGLFSRLSRDKWQYIGSAKTSGHDPAYLSVCLTRKDSNLTTAADLKAAGGALQMLAVDPLSLSGFINPVAALRAAGVNVRPEQIRFTHSHSNAIRCLADSRGPTIATVWASTWERHPDPSLRPVTVPGLETFHSLPVALVARKDAPTTASLQRLVNEDKFPGFRFDAGYVPTLDALPEILSSNLAALASRPLDRVGIDDIVVTLNHYNRTHSKPARLALVLAGGGAKCSYQAGATRALEEHLQSARRRWHDNNLDIHLVVGTSGGAINALAIAMGLTKTADGYDDLCRAWSDLDQSEIVCPPLAVRVNLWCWFASLTGLCILAINWRFRLGKTRSLLLTVVAGVSLTVLSRMPLRLLLGTDSNLQHIWAWLSWGIEGAGLVLVVAAIAGALQIRQDRQRLQDVRRTGALVRLMLIFAIVLPLVQVWIVFFHEEFVSENFGIEKALTRNFGKLIERETGRRRSSLPQASDRPAIKALSQQVFDSKLLQRDLVLTSSPLTDPNLPLPGEFYFYASPLGSADPVFGARGIALARRPELLFDALLGSAAIYPLFPSRRIENLPQAGQHVDLVDGSFAHRSPLEAAVSWGATHIMVVEASTQEPTSRGSLLDNFGASLCYLYDEAQLVDVRLRGQTVLYTLYPSAPHIGLLDFSPHLIRTSIEKGYREASGAPTSAYQRGGALQKELGPPVFWTP